MLEVVEIYHGFIPAVYMYMYVVYAPTGTCTEHAPFQLSSVEESVRVPLSQRNTTTAASETLWMVHPGHTHCLWKMERKGGGGGGGGGGNANRQVRE